MQKAVIMLIIIRTLTIKFSNPQIEYKNPRWLEVQAIENAKKNKAASERES